MPHPLLLIFIESYVFKVVPFFEIRPALEVYKYNMHLHM